MASPVREIVAGQLANAASLLYQSPPGFATQITKLTCANTDGSVHYITFHVVPSGSTPQISNQSTIAWPIDGSDTWNSPNEYGLVLNPGDALWGFADAATFVNVFASGVVTNG